MENSVTKINQEKWRHWQGKIDGWLSSGLTQREYCEGEKLKRATFDYWRGRIKADVAPAKAAAKRTTATRVTLVPVKLVNESNERHLILTSPGGWYLNVPATTDAHWLADLLKRLS